MQFNNIPGTEVSVSRIALGTWVFGSDWWGGAKESACLNAVAAAADHGINLIDTAPIYGEGRSESIVGKALKHRRDDFVLATKCGLRKQGDQIVRNLKPDSIREEIEASLRRLQTDRIDIYQLHWPDPETPLEATLEAMCDLQVQGKIRYIGVSNFDAELLCRAAAYTTIAILQNQYSLLQRDVEQDVLPEARKQGAGLLAYGPLAGGVLTGKYQEMPDFPKSDVRSFFYKYYAGEKFKKVQAAIEALKRLGHPLNQLALNWVRQQPGTLSVLAGGRNPEQVRQNAGAADWDLSTEERQRIEDIFTDVYESSQ